MSGGAPEGDYISLTETAGDEVSREQVERLAARYRWAAEYCAGRDVLEVACGTGQGVGYLARTVRWITAGDWSHPLLRMARGHYRERFSFSNLDAQHLPFRDRAFDVVLLFEAIYYLPDAGAFFRECRRVLRPGGVLLVATANPDLYDFNPSPRSHRYFGIPDLALAVGEHGFDSSFFGNTPIGAVSPRQRVLRPLKAFAARFRLIPGSNEGKKLLKRLVFGRLVRMPPEVTDDLPATDPPVPLSAAGPDRDHKVILCVARLR